MSPAEIITTWRACAGMRQRDIDKMMAAGVDVMSLAWGPDRVGFAMSRDRVVVHPDGRRFEFESFSRIAWDSCGAYIFVALDLDGQVVDLVAWRPDTFIANWLGRAALLGAENLAQPRIVEAGLRVHESPLEWLRAGREGVVVVDPVRAAPDLRLAEPLHVETTAFGTKLRDMLRVPVSKIMVDVPRRAVA